MSRDNIQDWMDWAAGLTGATAGDPLLSKTDIEDIIDGVMGGLGTLHTDPATIPSSATARPRGVFDSPNDLKSYLEGGALISYDGSGNPVPNAIVHILKVTLPGRAIPYYEVWIDETT